MSAARHSRIGLPLSQRLGPRQQISRFGLHPVGDAIRIVGALGGAGLAPGVLGGVGGVQRLFDVGGVRARDLAQLLAVDRREVVEIAAGDGGDPFAADDSCRSAP
jgi:hypothetical protein